MKRSSNKFQELLKKTAYKISIKGKHNIPSMRKKNREQKCNKKVKIKINKKGIYLYK